MVNDLKRVVSFNDLDVYRATYNAAITVMTQVVPKLPQRERYDLGDQLSRASKAIPRLIAEGYAKRHQRHGFQKYLDDAMAEANELVVSLCQCRDLYATYIDRKLCEQLIDAYDKSGRQLFLLARAWDQFKPRRRTTSPNDETGSVTDNRTTLNATRTA